MRLHHVDYLLYVVGYLRDIDIAFVCCNKPYTMTVEQCANVVKAIRPLE